VTSQTEIPAVLSGIRVLDLSGNIAGGLATMVLADYGADVLWIERPGGSQIRQHPAFPMWGRGKRSRVINLSNPSGNEQVVALAQEADVVIMDWRPGVSEKYGLNYASLSASNDQVIVCEISGFGVAGPFAHLKGYEAVVAAKIGAFSGPLRPMFSPIMAATFGAVNGALQGILAAIYSREVRGYGQEVRTSLLQGVTAYDLYPWLAKSLPTPVAHKVVIGATGATIYAAISGVVAFTADGRCIQCGNFLPHQLAAFLRATDLTDWYEIHKSDPAPEILRVARERIHSKTWNEWEKIFEEEPNIAVEPYRTTEEAVEHPQLIHNGTVIDLVDPRVGVTRQLGPLVNLSVTPATILQPAAELDGSHGDSWSYSQRLPKTKVAKSIPGKGPLDGVTVIELAWFYAAPFGTALLTDLGARVIKVENLTGDPHRSQSGPKEFAGVKALQGKESIAMDTNTPEGAEILHRLVSSADMVMRNFREDASVRMGVDYASLAEVNPRMFYLYAGAYGSSGPSSRKPAYAPTIGVGVGHQARQLGWRQAYEDSSPMSHEQAIKAGADAQIRQTHLFVNADAGAAVGVGTAMLIGLIAQKRFGIGQSGETSMLGTNAYTASEEFITYANKKQGMQTDHDANGQGALYRLYPTAAGWVFLAVTNTVEWLSLAAVILEATNGAVALADDPRYASQEARILADSELAAELAEVFRILTARDWECVSEQANLACVEVSMVPVADFFMGHPAILMNDFVAEVEHPMFGEHFRHGAMVQLSIDGTNMQPACLVGQHTDAILREYGYNEFDISSLKAKGIVAQLPG